MGTGNLYGSAFEIGGKTIEVFPSEAPNRPVIYLNTVSNEGAQVYQTLRGMDCPDFTLVAIGSLDWNHDMAPWDIPPISRGDTPCTGGADEYLRLLIYEIIPEAEKRIQGEPMWKGLAGYSLAGLFAVYSLYRADCFSRIASMSGSLWFPDFKEYVFSHEMKRIPEHLYLSLGDRECQTRNRYLKSVQINTEEINAFFMQKGIDTVFQLNPGNHFKNAVQRTAAGIAWILSK